jgi:biopolymer transport protein TolR
LGAQIGANGTRRRRQSALAEINVTPLVDVMLVLLIISMVAAPMLERGFQLELPKAESAEETPEAQVVVSVDRNAKIRMDERVVQPEMLLERLKYIAQTRPEETVFLQGDRLVPYGEMARVLDTIHKAGIVRVSLVTVPLDVPERSP